MFSSTLLLIAVFGSSQGLGANSDSEEKPKIETPLLSVSKRIFLFTPNGKKLRPVVSGQSPSTTAIEAPISLTKDKNGEVISKNTTVDKAQTSIDASVDDNKENNENRPDNTSENNENTDDSNSVKN